jgi:hypothetical protein
MPLEIDIELNCGYQSAQVISKIAESLPNSYFWVTRGENSNFISLEEYPNQITQLDAAIISFLSGLLDIKQEIILLNASLRIGLFHQLSETIICPIMLSKSCINLIYQFGLDLDISGYPCGDDE